MNAMSTLLKNPEVRVFGVVLLGLVAVAAVVAAASANALGRSYLTPASVLGAVAYFGLIWVLPAGVPAAAAGTLLATRVVRREPTGRPLWFWVWRAVATGAPLGAASAALWFVVMFMTVPVHLRRAIGPVTAIGAAAGAGVGVIVAMYCWRIRSIRAAH
jgi:hypothetical protein